MTNYSAWDSKATHLLREAEDEEKREKAEADKALGLQDGPRGPPTVKAESELKELDDHSEKRKEFINWSHGREVSMTHCAREELVQLDGEEVKGKCIKLVGCENVSYVIPEGSGVVKLILEKCKHVRVQILASIITSTVEAYRCEEVDIELTVPIGSFQVDECTLPFRVHFEERDHIGCFYHQNSPGLLVAWKSAGAELYSIGRTGDVQYFTRLLAEGSKYEFVTGAVRRGEGEFPIDLPDSQGTALAGLKAGLEVEAVPEAEELENKAEALRQAGNEMFRANDFMQAAMEYTAALELDPKKSTIWANRAQCWMKLGNPDKALADAKKCVEEDPTNAKGWFRQGMSLHAMKRYPEAIPPLLEAEKLEPKNKQIPEAIRMAQLMARKEGGC